ncbi:hypothetical protein GCM10023081_37390 [Arthrobacter ginkgonis]|uniref:Uncharacterized protein n=1 Tax=Arthrobacter ginkgonis TaxID=1630594 RepID=A0ABP7CV79_9MICC
MSGTWALVLPDANEWRALPRRTPAWRQMLVAWLIGAVTTGAAFVGDRAWETLDDDAWEGQFRLIDMLGLSGLYLAVAFTFGGWLLRRVAAVAAPLVLGYAAVPHTLDGYASAPVWWIGAAAAALWALLQAVVSVRQVRAVRALAGRSGTGRTTNLGAATLSAVSGAVRRSVYWALGLSAAAVVGWIAAYAVLATELGRTYEELGDSSCSDVLAAAAMAASILALSQWLHCGWRAVARAAVGDVIWQVPSGGGPVSDLLSPLEGEAGMLPFKQARTTTGCSCVEEFLRSDPDEDEEFLEHDGVPAAQYCAAHGIDQISSLTAEQFSSRAATPWFWDANSPEPVPAQPDADRSVLVGFAGHAFTGLPARFKSGLVEVDRGRGFLAEEREAGDEGLDEDRPQRPLGGVIDFIDLRPAGLAGHAIRYRHGRAWFDAGNRPNASDHSL